MDAAALVAEIFGERDDATWVEGEGEGEGEGTEVEGVGGYYDDEDDDELGEVELDSTKLTGAQLELLARTLGVTDGSLERKGLRSGKDAEPEGFPARDGSAVSTRYVLGAARRTLTLP